MTERIFGRIFIHSFFLIRIWAQQKLSDLQHKVHGHYQCIMCIAYMVYTVEWRYNRRLVSAQSHKNLSDDRCNFSIYCTRKSQHSNRTLLLQVSAEKLMDSSAADIQIQKKQTCKHKKYIKFSKICSWRWPALAVGGRKGGVTVVLKPAASFLQFIL
jgi:hypothetical protein